MKISVISNEVTWHTKQLEKKAKEMNVDLEVRDFENLNEDIGKLGDVVFWRAASVSKTSGRASALGMIKDVGKVLVNQGVFEFPFVTHKLFQQKFVSEIEKINHIETFTFADKDQLLDLVWSGALKFPFIQKPDLGARGKRVELINSVEDLEKQNIDYKKYIYQNFIKNTGDYRVLVLGGRPLGAMKRIAKEGEFLNNFSKGGSCLGVEDAEVKEILCEIAVKVASRFNLAFCGVDIIFDEEKKVYKFLELNTVAQWEGFQGATKIDVSKEIIDFFQEMHARGKKSNKKLISEYYSNNLEKLNFDKAFHYLSRMSLWEEDIKIREQLSEYKEQFIGENDDDILANFQKVLSSENKYKKIVVNGIERRKLIVDKYPQLGSYNRILFQALISKTVFGKDVRELVFRTLDKDLVIEMRDGLSSDPEAIRTLSTHAINYFYFLQEIYGEEFSTKPENFLKIAKYGFGETKEDLLLKIYLLTHCIIGESKFYSKKIKSNLNIYIEMLRYLEEMIKNNYFDVSLDNKMEFLVCAKICGYESTLKEILLAEANSSMSEIGNYLVDKLNNKKMISKNDFWASEHRNVLYLMAVSDKCVFDK